MYFRFADDIILSNNGRYGGTSILLQRFRCSVVTRFQANAPAASYWLRRVLVDGGRRE